ncbi:MAG: DNA protecting protein DprA [Spirochaetes bacterium GWD1_61_31]|nr:MAG: DNA protecting protein DprA [Spirochaetes bacterium GWB1_60_80]OHD34713.1 MAG: DNA protecting protein DprA [Spirochaetes bacterium GWC1_61_12]OHD38754.1 MAG: DNA protecting protein DprA [Spirochaetes bacterium GWD1_61_31]OHD44499.1 MAG: DNA protecting protein DprA [Spirochaetes bacterium GWE1_60_18]OHD59351.1 MAG: DNA protecting protein DprA [Spirochaetes bacterium GWF1_60_12]HAP43150.1 DNA-protecting protein DprA [Spirochaetaceae bacterium]
MPTSLRSVKALLLARMACLSNLDRIALDDLVADAGELRALSRARLEELCGRRFRSAAWEPELWWHQAEADGQTLRQLSIAFVSWFDPAYPALLRETSRPPFLLYVRGRLPLQDRSALAMVGTRFPTGTGLELARRLAEDAAAAGVMVVSGLARGIDAAAHGGALAGGAVAGGAPTVAVLGCGIDQVYPPANRSLAARIVNAGGGLVSEYPPGTNPARWTFPERNRIIAGLARATLVVEAPEGSGALITADFALEEGRDVFVAAACLHSSRGKGALALAGDGARPIDSFADIADDWLAGGALAEPGVAYPSSRPARSPEFA